ncbi:hypothetical protein GGS23DRAFT_482632 [Durotheca rogersii]|uniref:uncharacterized protein n=1 Tax=Durotheca rogersii TaxID=419775 RepID=UPI0022204CDC|nr:uncharacterized protein GGS23DRAFT_482632 [Durotheca rogersii]KAI5864101.1 hypothetical protein GGS23DRAFT_482632 [Durotheca rogersii]
MEANPAVTAAVGPLSTMKKLSPLAYFYEPDEVRPREPAASTAPKLIILASWMDARDVHIAKYIAEYQSIYPSSIILLVKFSSRESGLVSSKNETVQPAFAYIWSKIDAGILSTTPARPEILVHIFSNGGCSTMRALYLLFQSQSSYTFPVHTAVYDSCPGLFSFSSLYNVIMVNFPKGPAQIVAAPLVAAAVVSIWVWFDLLGFLAGEDPLSLNSRVHNDRSAVSQTNRTYIYGTADAMVHSAHIEAHAKEAVSKGFLVRGEVFEDSPHVSHMKSDSQRYWNIVVETWKAALG